MTLRRLLAVTTALAALTALTLAGCSTGSTGSTGSAADEAGTRSTSTRADDGAFPVTVEHAFGETTIAEEPMRVATLGWSDQDHALALGVAPVGATRLAWGGNDAGSSDWFDAALARTGLKPPVRYDDSDGAPVEEIAALRPDVILATNSGITAAEYAKLSKIAPVVAYPDATWVTPWQTSLRMVGAALGRSGIADDVAAQTQRVIRETRKEHPQLQGRSMIFAYLTTTDLSTIGIYAPQDPRVSFLHDLGLEDAPVVAGAIEPGRFYGTVSAERARQLESDVLLTWSENPGDMKTFTDHDLVGRVPAIARGHAYAEADKHVSLAVTNPTPLSIPFIVDRFVPHVAEAVEGS
jgi:iron complex transport system substrate-binding protein